MTRTAPQSPRSIRRPYRVAVAVSTGLFALACGPGEAPELIAGRRLYEENCQDCHGERARGDGPMAATLPVEPAVLVEHMGHHTMAELVRLIRGGIPPAMPPAPVDAEEIRLIIDYVWTLVPDEQVETLREMQRQVEEMEGRAMPGMPMDHQMPEMPAR